MVGRLTNKGGGVCEELHSIRAKQRSEWGRLLEKQDGKRKERGKERIKVKALNPVTSLDTRTHKANGKSLKIDNDQPKRAKN